MKRLIIFMLAICLSIGIGIGIAFAGNQTTSSTDASVIVDQARRYLHDPTTYGGTQQSIWSDTEMLQWCNDGTLDVVSRSHCLEDVEAETLVESQTHYPLADPFIVVKYVLYDDVKFLTEGSMAGFFESLGYASSQDPDAEGEPVYWTMWENDIIVYPSPDATAAGNDVDIYVIDRPATVAYNGDVLVPAQYDKALVYYIVAQGWAKDTRMDLYKIYMAIYQQELDRARGESEAPVEVE